MFFVVGDVPLEFFVPEGSVRFGRGGVFTPFMPVPEAAVDEYHRLVFWQYDVRFTW